jgi:hypothetical protein
MTGIITFKIHSFFLPPRQNNLNFIKIILQISALFFITTDHIDYYDKTTNR